jgi:hypothetical protein
MSIRVKLAGALGIGLDKRGGHAAGFVSLSSAASGKGIGMSRRAGKWGDASWRFIRSAAAGEVAVMHARYATCGEKDNPLHAHPFAIRREGKTVLYGAHNGIVYGGRDTAKAAGRDYTVDSRELFELLADGNIAAIQAMSGYGVINWVTPESGVVRMARLSSNSDFACVSLACGGIAWASTMAILEEAVKHAETEPVSTLLAPDVGKVYTLTPEGIHETGQVDVRVNMTEKRSSFGGTGASGWGGSHSHYSGDYSGVYGGIMRDYFDVAPSTPRPMVNRGRSEGPMFRVGDQFKGSDGIAWTKLSTGWIKDEDMKPLSSVRNATSTSETRTRVSDNVLQLPMRPIQSGLSTRARPGQCIHGAKLTEHCDSCTGPKTARGMAALQPDPASSKEEKVPDTARSARFFPAIQVVDGDIEWEPVEVDNGRVVWIPTDLDAMTDEQLGELTEAQWEAIMAQYTPEEEEETPSR